MYSFQDKVRYSEVDRHGKLSIPAVVNYLQDCSTFQSEALGVGIEHLKKVHRAWLLTSWQIDLLEDMHIGEDIKVGTWSYSAKGVYGYRNFVIRTLEDRPLVNADSLWVFVDTESGKPLKVTPEDIDVYEREEKIDMEYLGRKIKVQGEGVEKDPVYIKKYHIDTNGHVNNSWYVWFAMEFVPDDEMIHGRKINRLRVEYKKSAMYRDIIYPVVYEQEDAITVALNDEQGSSYAIVQLSVYE